MVVARSERWRVECRLSNPEPRQPAGNVDTILAKCALMSLGIPLLKVGRERQLRGRTRSQERGGYVATQPPAHAFEASEAATTRTGNATRTLMQSSSLVRSARAVLERSGSVVDPSASLRSASLASGLSSLRTPHSRTLSAPAPLPPEPRLRSAEPGLAPSQSARGVAFQLTGRASSAASLVIYSGSSRAWQDGMSRREEPKAGARGASVGRAGG